MLDKETLSAIFLIVLSVTLIILSPLLNIGETFEEVLRTLSTFLAGAFLTYLIQHLLQIESEKRRRIREHDIEMRKEVYGPIFKEISCVLETTNEAPDIGYISTDKLNEIMRHYLFSIIERGLQDKLHELLDRFEKYQRIHAAAGSMFVNAIKRAVKERFRVDIGLDQDAVTLRLEKGEVTLNSINLKALILRGIPPSEFVDKEKEKWGTSLVINTLIGGSVGKNLSDLDSLYQSVLTRIRDSPLYSEERELRQIIVRDLNAFLKRVEPFVTLKS